MKKYTAIVWDDVCVRVLTETGYWYRAYRLNTPVSGWVYAPRPSVVTPDREIPVLRALLLGGPWGDLTTFPHP